MPLHNVLEPQKNYENEQYACRSFAFHNHGIGLLKHCAPPTSGTAGLTRRQWICRRPFLWREDRHARTGTESRRDSVNGGVLDIGSGCR